MTAVTSTARRAAFPAAAVVMTCVATAVVLRLGTSPLRRYGATAAILLAVGLAVRARQATRVGIYCVFIALIPAFNVVREIADLRFGTFVVTPATAFLAVVLVLGAGHRHARRRVTAGGDTRHRPPWLLPAAALALVTLSGLVATGLARTTAERPAGLAAALWLDGAVLPVLVFVGIVTAEPRRDEVLMIAKTIVMAALGSVVLGLILNVAGGDIARSVNSEGDVLIRVGLLRTHATFTFGNPDQFALVGSLAVPVAAMLAVGSAGRARLWWAAVFVALVVANVYTFSRGGIIAVAVSLLFAAWFDPRARRLAMVVAIVTTMLSVSAPGIGESLTARFTQSEVFESEPVRDRARALVLATRTVEDRPLGTGAAAFRDIWREAGHSEPALQSPHNLLLGVAVEYGLAAGLAFVVWLVACGRLVLRGLRRRRGTDPLLVGLASGSVAFVVTGMLTGADLSHLAGTVPLATQTVLFFAAVAAAFSLATEQD